MPAFEFDVDASIAAGWDRFASHLADLLRDLVPGAIFDLAVPVLGAPSAHTPYIRFTAVASGRVDAEVSGGGSEDTPTPLRPAQLAQLSALGWQAADTSGLRNTMSGRERCARTKSRTHPAGTVKTSCSSARTRRR